MVRDKQYTFYIEDLGLAFDLIGDMTFIDAEIKACENAKVWLEELHAFVYPSFKAEFEADCLDWDEGEYETYLCASIDDDIYGENPVTGEFGYAIVRDEGVTGILEANGYSIIHCDNREGVRDADGNPLEWWVIFRTDECRDEFIKDRVVTVIHDPTGTHYGPAKKAEPVLYDGPTAEEEFISLMGLDKEYELFKEFDHSWDELIPGVMRLEIRKLGIVADYDFHRPRFTIIANSEVVFQSMDWTYTEARRLVFQVWREPLQYELRRDFAGRAMLVRKDA